MTAIRFADPNCISLPDGGNTDFFVQKLSWLARLKNYELKWWISLACQDVAMMTKLYKHAEIGYDFGWCPTKKFKSQPKRSFGHLSDGKPVNPSSFRCFDLQCCQK